MAEDVVGPGVPVTVASDQPAERSTEPQWVGSAVWRGIWQAIAAVLLTLAALWFLRQATSLVQYLILAALLSVALEPGVYYLHDHRGWRRGSATGLSWWRSSGSSC